MDAFVNEPSVCLVGRPVVDIQGIMQFLECHGLEWPEFQEKLNSNMDLGDRDAEWIIEAAARLCYMSYGKKGRTHDDHIKHLIEVAHGACIEHSNFNFMVWNVSRSLTHELVRHRIGMSYSQLSQRYVDESDTTFVVPPAIQELEEISPDVYQMWTDHCEQSRKLYSTLTTVLSEMYSDIDNKLERRKKARQAARSVLPNATETKIFVTMNGRSFRHLVELRANPAADLEIRKLAVKIFDIVRAEFPLLAHGMEVYTLDDKTEAVDSEYKKV